MRVGFDETDAQAVVYYGRYFPYFDRARVEYNRHLGLLHTLPEGLEFVMRRALCEYEAPARFDDELEVFIRVAAIGTTSMRWEMAVHHCESGQLLARAEEIMVLIDRAARAPVPVPDDVRATVEAFEGAI
jgi:acyl-CoA thioester hydrolase